MHVVSGTSRRPIIVVFGLASHVPVSEKGSSGLASHVPVSEKGSSAAVHSQRAESGTHNRPFSEELPPSTLPRGHEIAR
jgi:hypothetical protein